MPNQTLETGFSYPDGLRMEASTDGGNTFLDIGVLAQGANFSFNFDKVQVEPGNASKPQAKAKNMTIALEPSNLWTWNTDTLIALSGGLFVAEDVAGTPVVGGSQTVDIGFPYDTLIELTGRNASGAIPTSIVVTEDPIGTPVILTITTDYVILKNVSNQWCISILTAGGGDNTKDFSVVSDYTPPATKAITAGTSSKLIDSVQVRFRHYTSTAFTTFDFEFIVYSAEMNSGLQFLKKGVNEDGVDEITVSLTGEIDDSLADNAQLFKMLLAA